MAANRCVFFLAVAGRLTHGLQLQAVEPGPFLEEPVNSLIENEVLAQKIVLHDAAATKYARCLDGTPAAYYFSPGSADGANKWMIHHEGMLVLLCRRDSLPVNNSAILLMCFTFYISTGGGWCTSYNGCLQRSKTALGSSADTYRAPQEAIGTGLQERMSGPWPLHPNLVKGPIGVSHFYSHNTGYMSGNATVNPQMYNWNKVCFCLNH
jgi:hypothetical protein